MEDTTVRYFLVNETREEFEERKQRFAALTAAILAPPSFPSPSLPPLPPSWPTQLETPEVSKARELLLSILPNLKSLAPIFVTGSSGYLGMSLIFLLRNLGVESRGFDVAPCPPSTDVVGSVVEEGDVRRGMKGCKGVIHCAALHAPHLPFHSEEEFEKVNVQGTNNILKIALENNIKNIIFSSTTSLSISPSLKETEKERGKFLVVGRSTWSVISDLDTQKKELETQIETDTSRNAYGRTKRKAEKLCFSYVKKEKEREGDDKEGLKIAILRCSRFFLEDVFDSDSFKKTTPTPTPTSTSPPLSSPNLKANELRTGVRISLIDLLLTHLLSLSHLHQQTPCSSFVFGPFVVSSPTPLLGLLKEGRERMREKRERVYEEVGWKESSSPHSCPPTLRLYDSSLTWKSLGWSPYFDYKWLLEALDQKREGEEGRVDVNAKKFICLGLF